MPDQITVDLLSISFVYATPKLGEFEQPPRTLATASAVFKVGVQGRDPHIEIKIEADVSGQEGVATALCWEAFHRFTTDLHQTVQARAIQAQTPVGEANLRVPAKPTPRRD